MEQTNTNGAVKASAKIHSVNIYNREKISVLGAEQVLSSTEKEIVIKLKDSYMFVSGKDLIIIKLIPEEEELVAQGLVTGIRYENKVTKKSFLGKVFK